MIAVHLEDGRVEVRDVPMPVRPPGFALIRMVAAGICDTDLELRGGYYGFSGIPGHEFAGEVVEAEKRSLLGRRVVGEINLSCGQCEWCRRGLGRHCPTRSVVGIVRHPGVFSEYFTLPERNLHAVDDLAAEHAVFTEPLAAACQVVDQVAIPRGGEVAVLGDGKLGLLIAQVLLAHGAAVRVYGRHAEKLALAEAAGAAVELAGAPVRPASYDWVVEATGSADGLARAIAMTRPRGAVIMKSTIHGDVPLDTAPAIVNEITLIGSRCGRFEPALALLRRGRVGVDAMIAARFPLAEAPRAFERAEEKGVLKVLLSGM
jgi:threonine dehydrogenase-like Zn-dependent dehydrogenase